MEKLACNIVWLKRDLRTQDHWALKKAEESKLPTLVCYFFEPSLMRQADHAPIHWRFVYESLVDLKESFNSFGVRLYVFHAEVLPVFAKLTEHYAIKNIFAHQETGVPFTFERDKQVQAFCRKNNIDFLEKAQDGVQRGVNHRYKWQPNWQNFISSALIKNDLQKVACLKLDSALENQLRGEALPKFITESNHSLQRGGTTWAKKYLGTFLKTRAVNYNRHISKPEYSRKSCSRLSPYLAYGCLSVKQVFHATEYYRQQQHVYVFDNFESRLWWRSHYIQKLETEVELAERSINPAFELLRRDGKDSWEEAFYEGVTGFPMVDASIRCLKATGFMNFRMRAMLSTFFSFTLWLDWRRLAIFLANIFLDYEPGIHYPQLQMQAGTTGYHPLRIYNPTVQSQRHDPDGTFVKKWIPELEHVPAPQIYEPWKMTSIEQVFYKCKIGEDYPSPIVNFDEATRKHKDIYWEFRHRPDTLRQLPKVWEKHCLSENIKEYKKQFDSKSSNLIK